MNLYPAIPLLSLLLIIFVWSYVFGQRRRDAVNSAFLLVAGVGGCWIAGELLFYVPALEGSEEAILRAVMPLWISIGFLFLNFVYRLVGRRTDAIYWIALLAAAIGTAIDLATDKVLIGYQRYDWGVADIHDPVTHTAVCAAPVAASIFGLWLVFNSWRRTREPRTRSSLALVFFGGLITLTTVSLLNIIFPNFLGLIDFPRFGSSALALFILVIFTAVARYRFLSISVEQVAENLFEDVHEGIVLIDQRGTIRRMNRAAAELLDFDARAGEGVPAEEVLPGYSEVSYFQNKEITIGQDSTQRVLAISQSSNTKKGVELGKILILRDITEQKRAEEVLCRAHHELEQEVRRRTEDLRQAQKMEAIGTLAGGIAHDFNNLLAAILGFATAARDDLPLTHPVRTDLNEVVVAAHRAREIVQQMLAFSRRRKPTRKVVSITDIIEEALKLLRVSLPPTIKINCDITEEASCVSGDPAQLHQVVMNLCTNAYQATGDSPNDIGVALKVVEVDPELCARIQLPRPGQYVRVEVSDSGRGMTKDTIEQIFEPFFTTRPDGGGTGLGLATVLSIVDEHGGAIEVNSTMDEGSQFRVYLPRVHREPGLEDSARLPIAGGNERIMFVDDREQVARAGKRMLETLGYRVDIFTSPGVALEAFNNGSGVYDLVITDHLMPDINGLELASEILLIQPQLPIILVSGNADTETRARAQEIGIGSFLPKPLVKASAARMIRVLIDESQDHR